jgi:hypothetical protein
MIISLGAHNRGVGCLIRRGTYLGGGALGTWRRAFSPRVNMLFGEHTISGGEVLSPKRIMLRRFSSWGLDKREYDTCTSVHCRPLHVGFPCWLLVWT